MANLFHNRIKNILSRKLGQDLPDPVSSQNALIKLISKGEDFWTRYVTRTDPETGEFVPIESWREVPGPVIGNVLHGLPYFLPHRIPDRFIPKPGSRIGRFVGDVSRIGGPATLGLDVLFDTARSGIRYGTRWLSGKDPVPPETRHYYENLPKLLNHYGNIHEYYLDRLKTPLYLMQNPETGKLDPAGVIFMGIPAALAGPYIPYLYASMVASDFMYDPPYATYTFLKNVKDYPGAQIGATRSSWDLANLIEKTEQANRRFRAYYPNPLAPQLPPKYFKVDSSGRMEIIPPETPITTDLMALQATYDLLGSRGQFLIQNVKVSPWVKSLDGFQKWQSAYMLRLPLEVRRRLTQAYWETGGFKNIERYGDLYNYLNRSGIVTKVDQNIKSKMETDLDRLGNYVFRAVASAFMPFKEDYDRKNYKERDQHMLVKYLWLGSLLHGFDPTNHPAWAMNLVYRYLSQQKYLGEKLPFDEFLRRNGVKPEDAKEVYAALQDVRSFADNMLYRIGLWREIEAISDAIIEARLRGEDTSRLYQELAVKLADPALEPVFDLALVDFPSSVALSEYVRNLAKKARTKGLTDEETFVFVTSMNQLLDNVAFPTFYHESTPFNPGFRIIFPVPEAIRALHNAVERTGPYEKPTPERGKTLTEVLMGK